VQLDELDQVLLGDEPDPLLRDLAPLEDVIKIGTVGNEAKTGYLLHMRRQILSRASGILDSRRNKYSLVRVRQHNVSYPSLGVLVAALSLPQNRFVSSRPRRLVAALRLDSFPDEAARVERVHG